MCQNQRPAGLKIITVKAAVCLQAETCMSPRGAAQNSSWNAVLCRRTHTHTYITTRTFCTYLIMFYMTDQHKIVQCPPGCTFVVVSSPSFKCFTTYSRFSSRILLHLAPSVSLLTLCWRKASPQHEAATAVFPYREDVISVMCSVGFPPQTAFWVRVKSFKFSLIVPESLPCLWVVANCDQKFLTQLIFQQLTSTFHSVIKALLCGVQN